MSEFNSARVRIYAYNQQLGDAVKICLKTSVRQQKLRHPAVDDCLVIHKSSSGNLCE